MLKLRIKEIEVEGDKLFIKLASVKRIKELLSKLENNSLLVFTAESIVDSEGKQIYTPEELEEYPNAIMDKLIHEVLIINGLGESKKN